MEPLGRRRSSAGEKTVEVTDKHAIETEWGGEESFKLFSPQSPKMIALDEP